jgi:hypothetical protein
MGDWTGKILRTAPMFLCAALVDAGSRLPGLSPLA